MSVPDYIRTYSGHKFHTSPRPEDFDIRDIARGLACASRWGGHTRWWYPVVPHCLFVAAMLPRELKFDGLMHDLSEAYFCDIPSPFKALMPEYKEIEHSIMTAGSKRFGYKWPKPDLVKIADSIALQEEHRAFFPHEYAEDVLAVQRPLGIHLPEQWDFSEWETMSKEQISNRFIYEFLKLRP
jgi:hypothetical protein